MLRLTFRASCASMRRDPFAIVAEVLAMVARIVERGGAGGGAA